MDIRSVTADALLPYGKALRSVYADAFRAPPWNEGPERADAFAARLATEVRRPGFTAALAFDGREPVGFATAWTTPTPFPAGGCHAPAAVCLGRSRAEEWLCGAREVDELAVRPAAHGRGVGAALLDAVTADAPGGRAWLLAPLRSVRATSFYRHLGWTQATHPAPEGEGVAVFLGPRHPARTLAAQPL
ncbi:MULTISPECIES: GNAT family N-acetyltransferase [unclassified Streptomyces]|uniref:GNAT family N-acetyltransferase n=1 Tax=unclassified Streptomyces TaxID=2593676 RepID=UPI000369B368|nr:MULTISPECIES: GNAT family N-acetyltransferase [unclassified Streptomyces]MYX25467.1 GNAT family N-acetyltransferase [Streptomyces sp. SID8381]